MSSWVSRENLPYWLSFSVALALRLSLFTFVVPLDAVDDSYHHWVISFWTLKIGFAHGRMWDLYGQEYYWPPIPHLVESLLLQVLGSTTVIPYRVFNTLIVSSAAPLTVGILRNLRQTSLVAALGGLMVALSPLAVWETFAITEPIALVVFLLAIYLMPRSIYLTGLFLGLASASVAVYWVASAAFLVYYYVRERIRTENLTLMFGWLTVMFPYMLALQFQTGNFAYPVYYQFLVGLGGAWIPVRQVSLQIKIVSAFAVVAMAAFIFRSIFRKRYYDLTIALFSAVAAIYPTIYAVAVAPGTVGFIGRFFLPTWVFLVVLLAGLVGAVSNARPRFQRHFHTGFGIMANSALAAILVSLLLGGVLSHGPAYETRTIYDFNSQSRIGGLEDSVAKALQYYRGGTIVVNDPTIAYFLIQHGVDVRGILSTQYAAVDSKDALLDWLQRENVRMIFVSFNFRDDILFSYYPLLKSGQSDPPFIFLAYANLYPIFVFQP